MEKIEYLQPCYDSKKSFYKKAKIKKYYDNNNLLLKVELYSYDTLVLTLENNKYNLNYNIENKLLFSNTTTRHIKELLKQFYWLHKIKITNKADIIKYNNIEALN